MEESSSSDSEGENFRQKEKITTRIKNILDQYPDGGQIGREILQNADDAKARELIFIFDKRKHPIGTLIHSKMRKSEKNLALLQGPALIAYNSAVFEDKDFKGLENLGSGAKREDLTKTGKFVSLEFHLNDLISIQGNWIQFCVPPHRSTHY